MHVFGLGLAPQILDSATVNTIAQAIQQQEGYYPGSLAYRNNNPGNLVYAGQTGATQGAGGFAAFPSYDVGYQALLNQIQLYAGRGYSIQQMMNIYLGSGDPNITAPASQGDSTAYASTIASALATSPSTSLDDLGQVSGGADMTAGLSIDSADSGFSLGTAATVGAAALFTFLFLSRS